jgi:hypothetical protein
MVVTLSGIVTDARLEQYWNAELVIGIVALEQYWNCTILSRCHLLSHSSLHFREMHDYRSSTPHRRYTPLPAGPSSGRESTLDTKLSVLTLVKVDNPAPQ